MIALLMIAHDKSVVLFLVFDEANLRAAGIYHADVSVERFWNVGGGWHVLCGCVGTLGKYCNDPVHRLTKTISTSTSAAASAATTTTMTPTTTTMTTTTTSTSTAITTTTMTTKKRSKNKNIKMRKTKHPFSFHSADAFSQKSATGLQLVASQICLQVTSVSLSQRPRHTPRRELTTQRRP